MHERERACGSPVIYNETTHTSVGQSNLDGWFDTGLTAERGCIYWRERQGQRVRNVEGIVGNVVIEMTGWEAR